MYGVSEAESVCNGGYEGEDVIGYVLRCVGCCV